jgi:hypothetical protein
MAAGAFTVTNTSLASNGNRRSISGTLEADSTKRAFAILPKRYIIPGTFIIYGKADAASIEVDVNENASGTATNGTVAIEVPEHLASTTLHLKDLGGASAAANQDATIAQNLPSGGGTISGVYARAGTAPVGSSTYLTYDIHKNGTTIFTTQTNRIIFAASASTDSTTTIEVSALANNDLLTLDCDAVGNSTAGSNVGLAVVVTTDSPSTYVWSCDFI